MAWMESGVVMKLVSLRMVCLKVLCLLSAFVVAGVSQAAVYQWVDEKGKTHFSDKPPANVKAKTIELPKSKSAPAPQVSVQERKERQQRLVKALEEERLAKKKAKEEQKRQAENKRLYCVQLKARVRDSARINRYYQYDKNGERQYISDKKADAYRQSLKDRYLSECGEK